jgi:hypothetical protein
MPVIPALGRLNEEDHELETSLGYIARPCLKKQKKYIKERKIMFVLTRYRLCFHVMIS